MADALDIFYKIAAILGLPVSALLAFYAGKANSRGRSEHHFLKSQVEAMQTQVKVLLNGYNARFLQLKRTIETVEDLCCDFPDYQDVKFSDIEIVDIEKLDRLSLVSDVFAYDKVVENPLLAGKLEDLLRKCDAISSDIKQLRAQGGEALESEIIEVAKYIHETYLLAAECDGLLQQE